MLNMEVLKLIPLAICSLLLEFKSELESLNEAMVKPALKLE